MYDKYKEDTSKKTEGLQGILINKVIQISYLHAIDVMIDRHEPNADIEFHREEVNYLQEQRKLIWYNE